MKIHRLLSNPSTLLITLFSLLNMQPVAAQVENHHYSFSGTVEGTDPFIGFASPESPIPDLEVKIGDQLSGEFVVRPTVRAGDSDGNDNPRIFFGKIVKFHVELNGRQLIPDNARRGDILISNDTEEQTDFIELNPLVEGVVDVLSIATSYGGIGVGEISNLGVSLNLTDSSGQALGESIPARPFPIHEVFEHFDVGKGFIRTWESFGVSHHWGIMFSIDHITSFNRRPLPTASLELSVGSHIMWPEGSDDYSLEEAGSAEGPWVRSEESPVTIDGQKLVVLDAQSRRKHFRLVRDDR